MWPFWTLAWSFTFGGSVGGWLTAMLSVVMSTFLFVCRCAYGRVLRFEAWIHSCGSCRRNANAVVFLFINCCFVIVSWLFHDFTSILRICGIFSSSCIGHDVLSVRMPNRAFQPRQSCDLQCFDPLIYQSRPLGVGIWFFSHCEELGLWKDANLISND